MDSHSSSTSASATTSVSASSDTDMPQAEASASAASPLSTHADDDYRHKTPPGPSASQPMAQTLSPLNQSAQDPANVPLIELTTDDPFDWEAYISNYTGCTKVQRLMHIAKSSPSLRAPAAALAAATVKAESADTTTYQQALNIRNTDVHSVPLPPAQREQIDNKWIRDTDTAARSKAEKLELELRNYQNNLIKESIRMANKDIADHWRSRGALMEASKFYQRTRDFCATTEHVVEMCLNIIEVSLHSQFYSNVATFANKAETVLDSYNANAVSAASRTSNFSSLSTSASGLPTTKGANTSGADAIGALFRAGGSAGPASSSSSEAAPHFAPSTSVRNGEGGAQSRAKKQVATIRDRIILAQGIAAMGLGYFQRAAKYFLSLDVQYAEAYNDLASPGDVALYAVFCALATFPRSTLKSQVVERTSLRAFMDYEPHTREVLDAFWNCDYKRGLEVLNKCKNRHLLDIHLRLHLSHLTTQITSQSLSQFLLPFETVTLSRLSAAFGWTEAHAADQVLSLIEKGVVDAKLDLVDGVVYANKTDARRQLFEQTLRTGKQRVDSAKKILFRMQIIKNGMVYRDEPERGASTNAPRGGSKGDVDADMQPVA